MDGAKPGGVVMVIVLVVVVAAAGALSFSGNQVSKILSTVGGPVGPPSGELGTLADPGDGTDGTDLTESDGATRGRSDGDQPPAALRDAARIVYTGSLDLVVSDLPAALSAARTAIGGFDGYVGASRETNDGASPTATITFRIPSANWDASIAALRGLATKVVREETAATEVTAELIDLEARIRNLQASETALQAIAADAVRVEDLLDVRRELTTVRGDIERLDAQRAALVDRATYGTLATTFGLEVVAVQEAAKGWDAASEVDRASARLVARLQKVASAVIWFGIAWLPFIVALGALVAFAFVALRRTGFFRPRPPFEHWPPAA